MSNFLLHNDSLGSTYNEFISGMLELISIDIDEFDKCYKNQNFYENQHFISLCSNYGQEEQVIMTYVERNITMISEEADSDVELDSLFVTKSNGFLGISFNTYNISAIRQIINQSTYNTFKENERKNYDSTTFWDNKNIIFPNLVFCEGTKIQIENKGKSKEFSLIIDRLHSLDDYIPTWKNSNSEFNVKDCNQNKI